MRITAWRIQMSIHVVLDERCDSLSCLYDWRRELNLPELKAKDLEYISEPSDILEILRHGEYILHEKGKDIPKEKA